LKWNLFKEERVELAIKGVALLPPAKFWNEETLKYKEGE
jgi:hypothetical protein